MDKISKMKIMDSSDEKEKSNNIVDQTQKISQNTKDSLFLKIDDVANLCYSHYVMIGKMKYNGVHHNHLRYGGTKPYEARTHYRIKIKDKISENELSKLRNKFIKAIRKSPMDKTPTIITKESNGHYQLIVKITTTHNSALNAAKAFDQRTRRAAQFEKRTFKRNPVIALNFPVHGNPNEKKVKFRQKKYANVSMIPITLRKLQVLIKSIANCHLLDYNTESIVGKYPVRIFGKIVAVEDTLQKAKKIAEDLNNFSDILEANKWKNCSIVNYFRNKMRKKRNKSRPDIKLESFKDKKNKLNKKSRKRKAPSKKLFGFKNKINKTYHNFQKEYISYSSDSKISEERGIKKSLEVIREYKQEYNTILKGLTTKPALITSPPSGYYNSSYNYPGFLPNNSNIYFSYPYTVTMPLVAPPPTCSSLFKNKF